MIALKNSLPLIRGAHGNAVAFEMVWLRFAIRQAAGRAGYDSWWLVDDLVDGISQYLRKCYEKTVIDLPELEGVVCGALRDIGYDDVAACFCPLAPSH